MNSCIQFSFVYNLHRKSLWNPSTMNNTITQITQQLVLSTFENKKFENCFLATQAD